MRYKRNGLLHLSCFIVPPGYLSNNSEGTGYNPQELTIAFLSKNPVLRSEKDHLLIFQDKSISHFKMINVIVSFFLLMRTRLIPKDRCIFINVTCIKTFLWPNFCQRFEILSFFIWSGYGKNISLIKDDLLKFFKLKKCQSCAFWKLIFNDKCTTTSLLLVASLPGTRLFSISHFIVIGLVSGVYLQNKCFSYWFFINNIIIFFLAMRSQKIRDCNISSFY